jgi:TetR/AcrR family transcriptional regulator, transcriptional repressor for nem operon
MSEEVRMAQRRQKGAVDTAAAILDVAERLAQRRGFNGFSYADVAAALNITKASLHYHFAGKAQLGEALIARYAARFADALAAIDTTPANAPAKLEAYASLYADVLRGEGMCLCGVLAAEYSTLPRPMRDAVIRFFDQNEEWVTKVLEQGQDEGTLQVAASASDVARMIVGGLEGAMLVARPYGDVARFDAAARELFASLRAARQPVA